MSSHAEGVDLGETIVSSPAGGLAVTVSGVTKTYRSGLGAPVSALDDVSLEVRAGEVIAVSGPSGSGKSTLLHVVGAMDRPDEGSIQVGDQDITALRDGERALFRRRVGFVFQRFHLLPALTSLDNVLAPVMPYRAEFDKVARARDLLGAVGLAERANDLPSHLSGGEQQRVALARALINRPGIVLADEPTGNLDTANGAMVMDLLLRLGEEHGLTVIIATHDPGITARCGRVVRLSDGRLVADTAGDSERPTASGSDPGKPNTRVEGPPSTDAG
jgi:putative ABC transport system ATP-binding protein